MNTRQYIKRNIYRWHRMSSIVIALPVILWALSGFMHPVMTNIRPKVATQTIIPSVLDTTIIKVSLQKGLKQNGIDSFNNFRFVQIAGHLFYQVKLPGRQLLRYISATDGKELKNGDIIYSRFLAKTFLEQQISKDKIPADCCKKDETEHDHRQHMEVSMASRNVGSPGREIDCCTGATDAVMKITKGSKISNVDLVTSFNEEYKYINRLLPVYKVTFDRLDGIRVYVDPGEDRFAFAMDNNRAAFDQLFSIFHTWSWMDHLGNTKYVIMIAVTFLGLLTTLMGLYIFFTTAAKKSSNGIVRTRRIHRVSAITASVFVLMFTFSGGYHAISKLTENNSAIGRSSDNTFLLNDFYLDFNRLQSVVGKDGIINISLITLGNQPYFQVRLLSGDQKREGEKDLMKSMQVTPAKVEYIHAIDYTILEKGEKRYAVNLARNFSGYENEDIKGIELITKFNDEYPFVNKRLPVWKIQYNTDGNERYYVETSSGALASKVKDQDLYEGYSFALLHKHHFMDWGGKGLRDISTMFGASLVFIASLIGLILWCKVMRKKKSISAANN